ncbi:MAG: hypothetical protein PHI85_02940 [Victivallaceae bacterium]|nr:hypothetical protein [Victivallaceae bacterium]
MNRKFFVRRAGHTVPRTAIFMSGSGSNAEVLLKLAAAGRATEYEIAAIVTDNPEKSRARELAHLYRIPLVECSIRDFYHANGEKRVSLADENCRRLRREWTELLLAKLTDFELDFGIFAGFVPLCDITDAFPCLNVHPGDLTATDAAGRRLFVGLNTVPVERAILAGMTSLRSSVMVTEPLAADRSNVDAGPILGVSAPLAIDFRGLSLDRLQMIAAARPEKKPAGGFGDELETLAAFNQERLKYAGDHVVLPRAAAYFARGYYEMDGKQLMFRSRTGFIPVTAIEFSPDGTERVIA